MDIKKGFKILFLLLVLLPGLLFVLVSAVITLYIYIPQNYTQMDMPTLTDNPDYALLTVHGLKDTPDSWSHATANLLRQRFPLAEVSALNWNPYAQNTFRCSVDGLRIGEKIGQLWSQNDQLRSTHLIGHSCGAFVVLGACRQLKESRPDITIQTSYLDPVAIYGGLFWSYGIRHFGECADFSDAYIDTEDGVPGSNQLLPHTHTFDVTAAKKEHFAGVFPHVWPTVFYQQILKQGKSLDLSSNNNLRQRYPFGQLSTVLEIEDFNL